MQVVLAIILEVLLIYDLKYESVGEMHYSSLLWTTWAYTYIAKLSIVSTKMAAKSVQLS